MLSQSEDSTPRLTQQRQQQQERWCDVLEDGFSAVDPDCETAQDDGFGDIDSSPQIAGKSRRRRLRRKRGKSGFNSVESQGMHPSLTSGDAALARPVFQDRATQALVDLGLMVSTPGHVDSVEERSTSSETISGQGLSVATVSYPAPYPGDSQAVASLPFVHQQHPTSNTVYFFVPQTPILIGSIYPHPPLSR